MFRTIRLCIRYGSYPLVFGASAAAHVAIVSNGLPYWPNAPLITALALGLVALLERVQPYEPAWLADHQDTAVDILHAFTSLSLIFLTVELVTQGRDLLPMTYLWPTTWPLPVQILLAGFIIDFGLWFMHWASHRQGFLWRLHALHHSSERLYWLNGERRHPLSALILGAPGVAAATLLGAPAEAIGAWLAIVAVHLAFQHANLDYRVGPLRKLLGVAEVHRWHHKRDYEDAQVNFGEFWMLWDQLFGTFRDQRNGVGAGEVGIRARMPHSYVAQLRWPFQRPEHVKTGVQSDASASTKGAA